jgi:hypothetical protein
MMDYGEAAADLLPLDLPVDTEAAEHGEVAGPRGNHDGWYAHAASSY